VRCPFCAHDDSSVKDSRPTEDNTAIRRRRQCESCGARFTSFERSKLDQSVALACRKRPVTQEQLDQLVSGVQRQIETLGENEVSTKTIGELVMEGLRQLDSVAYIRFASVYRDFSEARDFEEFAGNVRDVGKG
jgi:transcriptional repressor NrdR